MIQLIEQCTDLLDQHKLCVGVWIMAVIWVRAVLQIRSKCILPAEWRCAGRSRPERSRTYSRPAGWWRCAQRWSSMWNMAWKSAWTQRYSYRTYTLAQTPQFLNHLTLPLCFSEVLITWSWVNSAMRVKKTLNHFKRIEKTVFTQFPLEYSQLKEMLASVYCGNMGVVWITNTNCTWTISLIKA